MKGIWQEVMVLNYCKSIKYKNKMKKEVKGKQVLADGRVAIYFKLDPAVWDKLKKLSDKEVDCTVTRMLKVNAIKLANTVK